MRAAIVSAATSPALLAAGTALLVTVAGLKLGEACEVIGWTTFVGLVAMTHRVIRAQAHPAHPRGESSAWAAAPVLVIVALTTIVLIPPGTRLSYHGLMHAGVAAQLSLGIIPPDDVTLAGGTLGYYWLYHWLLAVYTQFTGFSILLTSAALNVVSIGVYVGASYYIVRRFAGPLASCFGSLTVGFLGSLFFPVVFLLRVAQEGPIAGDQFWPQRIFKLALIDGDARLLSLTSKFFNMSGFPIGLAIFAMLLGELLPGGRRKPSASLVLVGLCGLIMFHTSTALAAYAALSLAFFSTSVNFRVATLRSTFAANARMACVFVAGLVLTGPYLLVVSSASGASQGMFLIDREELTLGLESVAYLTTPLVPVLLFGAVLCWRSLETRYLFVAGSVLLAMGILFPLPGANQYKFTFLSFLPLGALLFGLFRGPRAGQWALGRGLTLGVSCILALLAHGVTTYGYLAATSRGRTTFAGDGAFLSVQDDQDLNGALQWLRLEAPLNAVVVCAPMTYNESPTAAVSGRANYVLKGSLHAGTGGIHDHRMSLVNQLFHGRGDVSGVCRAMLDSISRPIYVLVTSSSLRGRYRQVVNRLESRPELIRREYSSKRVGLFRLLEE